MGRVHYVLAAFTFVLGFATVAHAQPTANDLRTSVLTHFSISGSSSPYVLTQISGTFDDAARAVLADMLSLGYPDQTGAPGILDGRLASTPIPLLFKGCAATSTDPINGGAGISLIVAESDVILLGVGYDGLASTGDPGTNAYVRTSLPCSGTTCYAVGGHGDSAGGAANGGWGRAFNYSGGGGSFAGAVGGTGINNGNGGDTVVRNTNGNSWAFGGDSDYGDGGNATASFTGGHAGAMGGSTAGGNGGNATVGDFGFFGTGGVGGDGNATGGSTTGTGNGGTALVRNTAGSGSAVGGNSIVGLGGTAVAGGNAGVFPGPRLGGTGYAQGGDGDTGGDATVYSTDVADARGGDGDVGGGGGNAGNALANSLLNVAASAIASSGSCPSGPGLGGSATATSPRGTDGPNQTGSNLGTTATSP